MVKITLSALFGILTRCFSNVLKTPMTKSQCSVNLSVNHFGITIQITPFTALFLCDLKSVNLPVLIIVLRVYFEVEVSWMTDLSCSFTLNA